MKAFGLRISINGTWFVCIAAVNEDCLKTGPGSKCIMQIIVIFYLLAM